MNGSDSTDDRATRPRPPNTAESTAHTKDLAPGLALTPAPALGVRRTDTELDSGTTRPDLHIRNVSVDTKRLIQNLSRGKFGERICSLGHTISYETLRFFNPTELEMILIRRLVVLHFVKTGEHLHVKAFCFLVFLVRSLGHAVFPKYDTLSKT